MILTPSRITASSHYRAGEPEWDAKTGPENLLRDFDDARFGWLSGVRDIVGAWVEVRFERPVLARKVIIVNGWGEHECVRDWTMHGRVKVMHVDTGLEGPNGGGKWTLEDHRAEQRITHLEDETFDYLKLTVATFNAGTFNVVGLGRLRVEGEWV